jgi:arginine/lysine/ornithine decarboxylase
MPGHKNNRKGFKELEIIRKNLFEMDNTEVPGLDNLHIPEGMILEAQKKAAQAFGAYESFFLVNGSTSGIYSMILSVTKPGDKVIIQRNSHRSVFMACLIGALNAVYLEPEILEEFNIAAAVDVRKAVKLMEENRDAKAIVLTNPSYYGTCSDLVGIVSEAHKRGIKVLVDEAHGAHFPFSRKLPKSAMECGADISVTSVHKNLPAMTQCAVLNASNTVNPEGLRFMLKLFQTTSPSYVLMASIDAARHIMQHEGEKLIDELLGYIESFRFKMKNIEGYKILGPECISNACISDLDLTKIVVSSVCGGRQLERLLRKEYSIQVEMSDINNIVLIGSAGDTKDAYDRLYGALSEIAAKNNASTYIKYKVYSVEHKTVLNMRDAYYRDKRRVRFDEAEGMISAELAAPYPPGIPVLLPGELITRDIIDCIQYSVSLGIPLNGIEDPSGEYVNVCEI